MFRFASGFSLVTLSFQVAAFGQIQWHADTLPSDALIRLYEFQVEVPLGQTFVTTGRCQGFTTTRYSLPSDKPKPVCEVDTTSDQHLHVTFSMGDHTHQLAQSHASLRAGNGGSHRVAGSITIDDAPSRYVMELKLDPNAEVVMNMDLGYGSARLDLSEAHIRGLQIVSGAADLVVFYNKPNAIPMKFMHLSSGMSKIFVRNLENSRAENIFIENAMGETKIVVGNAIQAKSMVTIDVGSGSCALVVHRDAPVRIVVNSTIFPSFSPPEGFLKTSDNTFCTHSYKVHSQEAMTIVVDLGLGLGSFEMIPFE
ncbi:MAG: hypothetical protein RLZZ165_46 [Bacteroidota bacterium]|jgi:hypothetical protein